MVNLLLVNEVCSHDDQMMTLTYFMTVNFVNWLLHGKSENNGFVGNYCGLRPETWQMQTAYEVDKGV